MKKFLCYIILFLLPFIIVSIPLEIYLRKIPNPYKYKYEWMKKNCANVEIIVLGNSHSYYGIRPAFLDGCAFSMANVSQGLAEDLFLLSYFSTGYKKLQKVILPISYGTLFLDPVGNGPESFRQKYYRIYMDCNIYNPLNLNFIELGDIKSSMEKLKRNLSNTTSKFDTLGWGTDFLLSSKDINAWNDISRARIVVERHTAQDYSNISSNISYIREIIKFCKKHHVVLYLVTMPTWKTYNENLDELQYKEMCHVLDGFNEEDSVYYFNYMKDPRFEENDFYDVDHLSDEGAKKFTILLNLDMKKL